MVGILHDLAEKDPTFAVRCHAHPWNKGSVRTNIAQNPAELYPKRPDFQDRCAEFAPGWFVATHNSNKGKARLIRMALDIAGLSKDKNVRFSL